MSTKKEILTAIYETATRLAAASDDAGEQTLAHILRMAAMEADDALSDIPAWRRKDFQIGIRPN